MKLTSESLKYPQIDAAFRYIYDNYNSYPELYSGYVRDVVEFGVYKCGSLRKICSYLRDNWSYSYYYGVDSWEGLPAETPGVSRFEKFAPGAYKAPRPNLEELCASLNYEHIDFIDKPFEHLNQYDAISISPCMLIHVDSDLYLSAKQALTWCFDNNLVARRTLIAFDEFESTDELAGEQLAWHEIQKMYDFASEEVWFNTYRDKKTGQRIRQSVWEVKDVG